LLLAVIDGATACMVPARLLLSRARASVITVGAALAVFWVMSGQLAHADDPQSIRPEGLAAVSSDPMLSVRRDHRRAGSGEDIWLLVQSAQPEMVEAKSNEESVLAVFPSSAPESLEEEVAKAHGLEIVGRTTIPSLGLRLVRLYERTIVNSRRWRCSFSSVPQSPRSMQAQLFLLGAISFVRPRRRLSPAPTAYDRGRRAQTMSRLAAQRPPKARPLHRRARRHAGCVGSND
jgi:hypothetical protein